MSVHSQSLSTLLKRTTIEDHDEVLKACNAALKESKGNSDTLHIQVVALLKLDRYEDTIRVIEEGGDVLKKNAELEYAYALYKVGDLEHAQRIAAAISRNRGAMHVEAQASYRLEDFSRAAQIYKTLSESHNVAIQNEANDLRINRSATDAQLEWKREGHLVQKKKAEREDLEAFETAYNAACGCIARGELGQAEVLLKRARDLCISSEDLSDEEKKVELPPISVQQLFLLSALGKSEQAEALAADISLADIPDLSTRQIAQINQLTIPSKAINPYLSHRILHSAPSLPKTDQLFEFQAYLKQQNDLAVDLLSSKFSGTAEATAKRLSTHRLPTTSAPVNGLSVANAAAYAQNQLGKIGLKSVIPLLRKRPNDVGLLIVVIHLYLLIKNHGSAIRVMGSFLKHIEESKVATDQDVRFAPGLIAVIVSLYSIAGRRSHVKTELAKAASYWRHKSKTLPGLMHAAGFALLESSNTEDLQSAGEIFESLRQQDPKDRCALAGYVAAYAGSATTKVDSEAEQLTAIERLTSGVNVENLERAGIPPTVTASKDSSNKRKAIAEISKPPKKRRRKSKLPKDYDPDKVPDPERWLPLRDRSSYRPKGKKGKQKAIASTQGGVSEKAAESLDIGGSSAPSKTSSTVISGSSKQAKKKKPKK